MTTFDEREKAFEKKFVLDEDLKFRAEARRNKKLAEWAGAAMGLGAAELAGYATTIQRADLLEKGDQDVLRRLMQDFAAKGVTIGEAEVRKKMNELLAEAVAEIEKAGK